MEFRYKRQAFNAISQTKLSNYYHKIIFSAIEKLSNQ